MCNLLTDKQKKRAAAYYRGYDFRSVRNKTILMLVLYSDIGVNELAELSGVINKTGILSVDRQVRKYIRLRDLYFDGRQFEYLFVTTKGEMLTVEFVGRIINDALVF